MPWVEGQDGTHPVYRERLYPGWWVWLVLAFFVGSVGVAYAHAFGATVGLLISGAGFAAAGWALITGSPVLQVDERVFRAGRARLPREWIADVTPLRGEASRDARSVDLDPATFLLLRTWSTGDSLRLRVTDPHDPHPAWIVSTKRPDELAAALAGSAVTSGAPPPTSAAAGNDQGGSA